MWRLIKLELRKLISGLATKIAMLLMIAFIVCSAVISINSENYDKRLSSSYDGERGVKGIKAIKERKTEIKKIEGYLDAEKLKDVIEYSKKKIKLIKDHKETEMNLEEWKEYNRIESNIILTFSEPYTYDELILEKIDKESLTELYENRVNKIEAYLNEYYDNPQFDERDKGLIIQKAKQMEKPLYFTYADGWRQLVNSFKLINIIIILGICFIVIRSFTEDINNGMVWIVKSTVHGKDKLAFSRILACSIFTILTYIVCNLIYGGIILLTYGIDGWNSKIQIYPEYWLSIYNINFSQAYLIALIVGICVCLFMVMFTLAISNIIKKDYTTYGSVVLIFLLPLMINTKNLGKTLNNLVELLPIRALNVSFPLKQLYLCNLFWSDMLRLYVVPIVMIPLIFIMIPVIVWCYRKQKI